MVPEAHARRPRASRAKRRAAIAALLLVLAAVWFSAGYFRDVFGRQYEYEEDLTIALDGSARLTINASIPALVALRGLPLDVNSDTVDRDRIRAAYDSAVARVVSVPRPWRRRGRRFVQINLDIPDIRQLSASPPLSWSRYELVQDGDQHVFRQHVGPSAFKRGSLANVGWDGREILAFRVHFPSRILHHNARDLEDDQPTGIQRGNILAWEQHLSDRLDGQPVVITVHMESRSILYRTLFLFAGAFAAALLTIGAGIWWLVRRGRRQDAGAPPA